MKILDTDLLIAILKEDPKAKTIAEQIEGSIETATVTIFNAEELLYGALLTRHKKENYETAIELLSQFEILMYDTPSMEETIRIKTYLRERGVTIGVTDERIAGIALSNNATIVTRNTKHFSRIPQLKVVEW